MWEDDSYLTKGRKQKDSAMKIVRLHMSDDELHTLITDAKSEFEKAEIRAVSAHVTIRRINQFFKGEQPHPNSGAYAERAKARQTIHYAQTCQSEYKKLLDEWEERMSIRKSYTPPWEK